MARDVPWVIIMMLSHGRRGQVDSLTGGFYLDYPLDLSPPFGPAPYSGASISFQLAVTANNTVLPVVVHDNQRGKP